jgi:hypothetical protein
VPIWGGREWSQAGTKLLDACPGQDGEPDDPPPELWRFARYKPRDAPAYVANRKGDRFTFEVYRAAVGRVGFAGTDGELFTRSLVQDLPNGHHTLEITADGDGPIAVDSFYVFQPPLE